MTFKSIDGKWGSIEDAINNLKQHNSKTFAILYATHKWETNLTLSILQAR
jgi:hypothetical protein